MGLKKPRTKCSGKYFRRPVSCNGLETAAADDGEVYTQIVK